jgi:hypothetical protein
LTTPSLGYNINSVHGKIKMYGRFLTSNSKVTGADVGLLSTRNDIGKNAVTKAETLSIAIITLLFNYYPLCNERVLACG